LNFVFNVRCQFQLKHHWLGKNEKKHNRFVAPSRNESGLFCYPETNTKLVEPSCCSASAEKFGRRSNAALPEKIYE
jgi:hypothetical protein